MRVEGHVGPSLVQDGVEGISLRQGRGAELVVTHLHGRYYESCARGNVFYACGATAGTFININTGTVDFPSLFNPLGSNINCSLIRLSLSYTGTTTSAVGAILLGYTADAGAQVGTAAKIPGFTNIASTNALIGSQNVAKTRFSTTNTVLAAPPLLMGTGISEVSMTPAAANAPIVLIHDFDGALVIAPGSAVHLYATAKTWSTFLTTYTWEEVPI